MKKYLFSLILLTFLGCYCDDVDPCLCDRIIEVTTVQTLRDGKIEYESTILTVNECSGEKIWKHSIDDSIYEVPLINQCF